MEVTDSWDVRIGNRVVVNKAEALRCGEIGEVVSMLKGDEDVHQCVVAFDDESYDMYAPSDLLVLNELSLE